MNRSALVALLSMAAQELKVTASMLGSIASIISESGVRDEEE